MKLSILYNDLHVEFIDDCEIEKGHIVYKNLERIFTQQSEKIMLLLSS